ncbi:aspartate/glutamate racemase family protein [Lysobacter enzymogenes]|uniref:aspartate/glutamate racemase family protein n=1 Tax=Lysobacter enzymogenes TaxID=69 RepID=UPI00384F9EDD
MSEPQLRTLGLLGGMSWESTLPYYRLINQTVRERLGGLHSARLLLYSVDFAEIERMQHAGDWDAAGAALGRAACALRDGGAQLLVICTNTMHKVADAVEQAAQLPLLHIADPTGAAIRAAGLHRIGLLGTRFTMEQDFYRQRLQQRHGLEVLVPDEAGRETVHRIIYDELCLGAIREESRQAYRGIIAGLVARGAQGVILGCTEIGLLIGDGDVDIPLFDTAALHARAAALASIGQG